MICALALIDGGAGIMLFACTMGSALRDSVPSKVKSFARDESNFFVIKISIIFLYSIVIPVSLSLRATPPLRISTSTNAQ
jgi:hypothetical protein